MLEYKTSFESTLGEWSYKPDMQYKLQTDTVAKIGPFLSFIIWFSN